MALGRLPKHMRCLGIQGPRATIEGLLRATREKSGQEAAVSRAACERACSTLAASAPELEAALAAKVAAEVAEADRKADRLRRLAAGEVAAAIKVGDLKRRCWASRPRASPSRCR